MSTTRSPKYCVNVTLFVNPQRREQFLECIRENQKGTLTKEPKARGYTWGESTSNPNTFHFQEQFENKSGFEEHTQSLHFQEWQKFANLPDAFSAPPDVSFFEEGF